MKEMDDFERWCSHLDAETQEAARRLVEEVRRRGTPWPPVLPAGTHAWCRDCEGECLPLVEENSASCVDILCSECRLVLLTLYRAG